MHEYEHSPANFDDPESRDKILAFLAKRLSQQLAQEVASEVKRKKRGSNRTPCRQQIKARRKKGRK